MKLRSATASALAFLLALPMIAAPPQDSVPKLRIIVVEGDGAINNVRLRHAKEPVIRVEDAEGKPVKGAVVSFIAPVHGPGASFMDGQSTNSVATDGAGVAIGRGIRPNQSVGEFQIRVVASHQGESATARITQINAEPAAAGNNSRKILLITLIGAAAAGGAAAALGGKSGSKSAVAAPGTTISAGSPGFGPPQ